MMLNAWAFKQMVQQGLSLHVAPENDLRNGVGSKSVAYRFAYCLFLVVYALGALVITMLFNYANVLIKNRCHSSRLDQDISSRSTCEIVSRSIRQCCSSFLAAQPLCLGVGYIWNKALIAPFDYLGWHIIKYGIDNPSHPGEYESSWLLRYSAITILRTGILISAIMSLLLKYQKAEGSLQLKFNVGAANVFSSKFKMHLMNVWARSLAFAMAWLVMDVFQYHYFVVMFSCYNLNDCGSYTLWYHFLFAVVLSVSLVKLLPALRAKEERYRSLGTGYTSQILGRDRAIMDRQVLYQSLYSVMLGIVVGWSWVGLMKAECAFHESFTCPTTLSTETFLLYFLTVVVYTLGVFMLYHIFIENSRIHRRCTKVAQLKNSDAKSFFEGADADNDGRLTELELTTFLDRWGLDHGLCVRAFHRKAVTTEDGVETCDGQEFVNQFDRLGVEDFELLELTKAIEKAESAREIVGVDRSVVNQGEADVANVPVRFYDNDDHDLETKSDEEVRSQV